MNGFLEVLIVQGVKIDLKLIIKMIKSLKLGISEGEEVMMDNEKIDQEDSFTA